MLDYNEIYIILNSYSYNERSLNVYDNKTNMQKLFKKDPVQK